MSIRRFIVQKILRPKWVAFQFSDGGKTELGLCILGIVVSLHKGDAIFPIRPVNVRRPGKREFGESLYPVANTINPSN